MKKVKPIKCYHCGRILYDEPQISFTIREGMCIDCYDRIREDKECGLYSYAEELEAMTKIKEEEEEEKKQNNNNDILHEDIDTYLSRF